MANFYLESRYSNSPFFMANPVHMAYYFTTKDDELSSEAGVEASQIWLLIFLVSLFRSGRICYHFNCSSLKLRNRVTQEQKLRDRRADVLFVCLFVKWTPPKERKWVFLGLKAWNLASRPRAWRLVMPPSQVKPGVQT